MNYLIVYDHMQSVFSPEAIHNTIINISGVTDWWHYLPNVYIVSTLNNEKYLANKIIAAYPGLLFFVVAVDLHKYNGVLKKSAWEWINKKTRVLLRIKPTSLPPKDPFMDLLFPTKPRIASTKKTIIDLLMEPMKKRAGGK